MAADSRPGPWPGWNTIGLVLALVAILVLVPMIPPQATDDDSTTTTSAPGRTVTLDELEAMLTDSPGAPPATVRVETPEGPLTVVVPATTTTSAPPATTTTTTTTTTEPRPRPTLPPVDAGDILDDLLGQAVPTTLPEVVGDAP